MKAKIHEDDTKAAKTPIVILYAKSDDNRLWLRTWQNQHQQSVNDFWSCITGNLHGD